MEEKTLHKRSIVLPNDVQYLPTLNKLVDEACESVGFDQTLTMQMNLAIEEAIVNVMEYAYPKGDQETIKVDLEITDGCMTFVISDRGIPFDPTTRRNVDITLSAEERPIGGLGIHLVKTLMDSVNYQYVDGWNILKLSKNF